jgi:hypothetical protein
VGRTAVASHQLMGAPRTPAQAASATEHELLGRLTRLESECAALSLRVSQLEAARHGRNDRALLAAIADAVQETCFSASELRAHAAIDETLAPLVGLSTKQIGARLRALANRPLGGLSLRRVARDNAGSIWAVVHVIGDMHVSAHLKPRKSGLSSTSLRRLNL